MSQEAIFEFLRRSPGVKFLAEELQKYLDLGQSIYPNLKKLSEGDRPQIKSELCADDRRRKLWRYWVDEG